jgi:hypothetical protein
MPNLADLHNSTVSAPSPELHEALVLDDATERGQDIRCVIPSFGEGFASDPMAWEPYTTAAGEFWPKKDERAVLAFPPDGPPVVVWWEPGVREPDAAIEGGAGGSSVFVPYLIPAGSSFVVPANKQALWAIPIEVEGDGVLEVNGALVEVS